MKRFHPRPAKIVDKMVRKLLHLAVSFSVLLAVASVGVLIYFIHPVSVSIQANEIAARISKELIERIAHLFPEHIGPGAPTSPMELPGVGFFGLADKDARLVAADGDRYVQPINGEALLVLATKEDLLVRFERRPGDYVVACSPLALIWP